MPVPAVPTTGAVLDRLALGSEMDQDALRADCERCFGLCCVAPAFVASADFAITKHAGEPCPNLAGDHRCSIHDSLRRRGFPGCAVYDCFGAGQKVAQVTFEGRDWRRTPGGAGPAPRRTGRGVPAKSSDLAGIAAQMFEVFAVMRQLHELLWYLDEALSLALARPIRPELRRRLRATEDLTRQSPADLARLDVSAHRRDAQVLLRRASELVRAGARRPGADHAGADFVGRNLRGADLRGADLAGALLIRADLGGADLDRADLAGADLRGADLRGARLARGIFLTQPQVEAARGDGTTTLPPRLRRPAHWR